MTTSRVRQTKPHLDAIVTDRLPSRCPKCGRQAPDVDRLQRPQTFRAFCPCGWSERYEVKESE